MYGHRVVRYAHPVGTYVTHNKNAVNNEITKDLILGRVEGYNENGECLYIKYIACEDESKVGTYQYFFSWRVNVVQHHESKCKMNFRFE